MRNQTVETDILEQFAPEVARDLTVKICASFEGVLELIKSAYSGLPGRLGVFQLERIRAT